MLIAAVFFSAFMLLIGRQEGQSTCKNQLHKSQRLLFGRPGPTWSNSE